ncbi:hypothetical protein HXX76_000623 [Chlamydomonas incerta]|uniref:procollagen-proline 3-dioxygenase n=1 Tax=Chlamydomonas incerta TaxID=51695 RepID=A0A835WEP3_CHLIN|nr:hypothetical protein HXX76_000623 [Chlamydomonas incerta]|eukprot:KAG2446021.1 hypothetical protein HXX76_000623 [Chlamydomonas incerta]
MLGKKRRAEYEEADAERQSRDLDAQHGSAHPRLENLARVRSVEDGVVPLELCRELVMVYQAVSTVGYRPHVRSATIHDVVTAAPWLLPPLARARHAVLCAVEAAFGLGLELGLEFTGLIGWRQGAALGWHHDANREYLSRRHMSAVLYLNDQGADFGGGDFRFQDGPEPLRVSPRAGRMVAYTADARNVHCVEPVAWGERVALTLWFTLEPAAAEEEDAKVAGVLEQLLACPQLQLAVLPPPGARDQAGQGGQQDLDQQQQQEEEKEDDPGLAQADSSGGVWLGRGLPDTMYLLHPRQPEAQAQAQPEVQAEAESEVRQEQAELAAPGREPAREAHRDREATSTAAGTAAQQAAEPVDIRAQRLRELGLHARASGAAAGEAAGGSGGGTAGAEAGPATGSECVWVHALAAGAGAGLEPAAGGTGQRSVGLRFGSLTEALLATAFTVYRLGCVAADAASEAAAAEMGLWGDLAASTEATPEETHGLGTRAGGAVARLSLQQLAESVAVEPQRGGGPLRRYVAAATAQLRRQLPEWVRLGSLLGACD